MRQLDGVPQILEDHRWGPVELYLGYPEEPLLIHPAVKTCAVFLGRKLGGELRVVATAFWLSFKDGEATYSYLVTASHIVEHTRDPDYSDDGKIYLYLNSKRGKRFQTLRTDINNWYSHPTDAAVDVAVLSFPMLPDFDHTGVEAEEAERMQNSDGWQVEVGTDVFITGLFLRHFGRERNIPIVRTGTIAALPEEPIYIGQLGENERRISAYLVESHSIGGLSGSPVFANPTRFYFEAPQKVSLQARHIWIGVISAHWQFDVDKAESEQRNSGIAIVSPRESVLEVLQHPRLIEMREAEKKKRAKATAPTLDDAQKPKRRNRDVEIPSISREKFFDALGKVTRHKR